MMFPEESPRKTSASFMASSKVSIVLSVAKNCFSAVKF